MTLSFSCRAVILSVVAPVQSSIMGPAFFLCIIFNRATFLSSRIVVFVSTFLDDSALLKNFSIDSFAN